jgi:hypothetical protein
MVAGVLLAVSCATASPSTGITRDRAVAIARAQVRWQPFDVAASRLRSNGRSIWRVTLKGRLPDQPPMLYETAIIDLDAATGAIVSLSKA